MNRRILFFLGLLWILATMQPAQTELGSANITNYEPEQYKAQQQNWVAVQDRRGVMYFGNTDGGILEFDGQQWRFIPTPGFSIIRALTCGPDGTIYYGAIDDFGYLAASPSGKLAAISLRESIPLADRSFADVWQALSNRYGVYFLTSSKIFRLVNGKVTSIQGNFTPFQACLLNDSIFCVDSKKGICMLAGDQMVPIPQLAGVYNGELITIAPFGRHELLVGRISGDFLRVDLAAFWDETSRRYDTSRQAPPNIIKAFPAELADFLKENNGSLVTLVPIGTDTFAIGTVKGGIVTFDRTGKIIRVFNKNRGLMDDTINGLFIDRAGNLWACTNGGISYIELSVPQSFFGPRDNIKGLSLSAQFHNGRMYVGTMQGLYVLPPQRFALQDNQQSFTALKNSPAGVWQFLEVDGELMAATSQGLFMIKDDEAIKIQGSLTIAYCMSTSIKRWPGHIFVGYIGSINVFKRTAGQWEFIGKMEGLNKNIRGLAEDANGDLWAGTDVSGLLRMHFSTDKPTQAIIQQFGPKHGLPGLFALWNVVARDNKLFVTTPKGLYQTIITPESVQFPERIRFTPEINIGKSFSNPPVAVSAMNFNQEGSVFFTSDEGAVWAIPQKDGHYRIEKRPFLGISLPTMPTYCHPDGSVWLPGGKLLYRVDLKIAKDYDQTFDVLIRKITTKSKRLLFAGTHGRPGSAFAKQLTVFASNQDILDVPELPFRENALAFEFAAAFYEKPGTTQFQYLLEGFDKEWSAWIGDTKKEYTNLPEGKYKFRVRAKNIYGTMGREAIFSLRILPPWYRTWWAYILWVITTGGALAGIIYLYTLKLKKQKYLLKQIVAERTQALVEANDYLESLFDYANAPIIVWDPQFRITRFNHAFETLTGRISAEVLGKRLEILFPPEHGETSMKLIQKKLSGEPREVVEIDIQHMDRSIRTVLWNSATLLSADGKIALATISQIQDITGRKIAEEKIKNLLAEKELILKEVHHRIKNNMATVKGLFSLQADTLKNPEAIAALKDAGNRVQSMVVLYEKLYQSSDSNQVAIGNYLPSLVDEIVANFPNSAKVKVEKKIADFVLNAKKIQPLGIIINELLTNIMKYAFTGRSDGLITVAAELKGNRVSLAIQDNGIGMPETVDFENSTGFGLRLVCMLTKQIEGTIRIEHGNGTKVILEF